MYKGCRHAVPKYRDCMELIRNRYCRCSSIRNRYCRCSSTVLGTGTAGAALLAGFFLSQVFPV